MAYFYFLVPFGIQDRLAIAATSQEEVIALAGQKLWEMGINTPIIPHQVEQINLVRAMQIDLQNTLCGFADAIPNGDVVAIANSLIIERL